MKGINILICVCFVACLCFTRNTGTSTEPSETSVISFTDSNTTLNGDNTTATEGFSDLTFDQGSTSNNGTDSDTSDTIIVFSTPLYDKNSTNGTDDYNTTFDDDFTSTTTFTIDEDISESNETACSVDPCKNGGTCKENPFVPYFTCECAAGFVGIRCQTRDRCVYEGGEQPCKEGFCSYSEDGLETFCACFVGKYWNESTNECRDIKSACDTSPCENGGQCKLLPGNKYNCTCETGFSGESCEVTDRCVANQDCGHGLCVLSGDKKTRSCKCDDGFHVQEDPHTCRAVTSPCDSRPCHNGGFCNWFDDDTYNCTCAKGFSGKACEIVDLCTTSEDCGHGNCTLSEEKKTRSCNCSDGFHLQKRPHTCINISSICEPNPCKHYGVCTVLSTNEYNCTCSDGYTGNKCEVRDMCIMDGGNVYCKNATCRNNFELGVYYCTCSEDEYFQYTDRSCVAVDPCRLMQCGLNEKCLNGQCICKDNYENSTGKCSPNFCSMKNACPVQDMVCKEGTGPTDFKCSCREGYTFNGTHCNAALCIFPQLNDCEQMCTVTDDGYECSCDKGFKLRDDNKTCERKDNKTCEIKVCDKGSCVKASDVEVCICPPGYIEVDGNCTDVCTEATTAPSICPEGCELTEEGGFKCKCKGKFEQSEDKITCVVRNMCQENESGWQKCREKNAECVQKWNESEGFQCKCANGQVETNDGICRDVCSVEANQRACYIKGGTCDANRNGSMTCRCPPYFQSNEINGQCNKIADFSYLITLPLDLSTYALGNRMRRSLDTSVDYRKISRDATTTFEGMFVGYKQSNVLYCNSTSDYLLCKIELQFETEYEAQLKLLETEDICLTYEDAKKCLLPPALVLVKERISEDVIIEATDLCEPFIKDENCGSETTCASSLSAKSFICTCKPGFSMRTRNYYFESKGYIESCRDVDECITSPCSPNSMCLNTIGSYNCKCMPGFRSASGDSPSPYELKCVEICRPNPCTHGLCSRRNDHDFDCKCDAGYRGALCDLQDENFKRARNNSIIVGVVLGGILLITFILFAVCVSRLRKRKCMENTEHMFYGSTEMKERGRINNAFQRE